MSETNRVALVNSGHLIFQHESQKADLLNIEITNTNLIEFLDYLVAKGWYIEITAVRSDHSDDSWLGRHCHYNGFAIDCWLLRSKTPQDYADATDSRFAHWLADAEAAPHYLKTGLAGTAFSPTNVASAPNTTFHDDGADHVHFEVDG